MKKKFLIAGVILLAALVISGVAFAANSSYETKAAAIEEKVQAGNLSQDEADAFLEAVQARIAECGGVCDGSGPDENRERLGQEYGVCFANGYGNGEGKSPGSENGGNQGFGKMNRAEGAGGFGSGICRQAQ